MSVREIMDAKVVLVLALGIILLASDSYAASIKGGEITLVRPQNDYIDFGYVPPEYVSIEDLVFYTCIEENAPIRTSVLCKDDTSFQDLDLHRWEGPGNCFMASYDLSLKDCGELLIESEYQKDDEIIRISQEVKVNRYSSILDLVSREQYSDGGWKNATETASGAWVLSHYREIYKNEMVLANNWLKQNRNNEMKCWPELDCSVDTTAKILAYLTLARNNDTLRIMHDGQIFLKKMQNFYKADDIWNLTLTPFEAGTTNCLISYNKSHLNNEQFAMLANETAVYQINPNAADLLIVACDQNIDAVLATAEKDVVFVYEGDNMTYTIPYACWPSDAKWGACSPEATLFALMTDIDDERKDAAYPYVESLRMHGLGDEDYIGNHSTLYTALYAGILGNGSLGNSSIYDNDALVAWLRFRQNNEGSWGDGSFEEKISPTAFSILGLMQNGFERNNEVIEDAEKWINDEELLLSENKTSEYAGWNSTERDALAFTVLKNNARPLLKINPMKVVADKSTIEIDVYNPTTFPLADVTYHLSDNLNSIIHLEDLKKEISAYSYIKVRLVKDATDSSDHYGFLSIHNLDEEIAKVPVMVVSYPDIKMTAKEQHLRVFGTNGRLNFDVVKSSHAFDCNLAWKNEDITSKKDYKINTDTVNVDISFKEAERIEDTYKGEFTCTSGDAQFIIPFSVDISRYSSFPFTLSTDMIVINSSARQNFYISNNLDESIDVELKFLNPEKMLQLSSSTVVIDPNDEINISIFNTVFDINITKTSIIEITALGQKKTINALLDVTSEDPESTALAGWIVIAAIFLLISGAGAAAYYYKDKILSLIKKENKVDTIKVRIKKLEEREKSTAINNMVRIMRMLNKDEKLIRERLLKEGFNDADITKAIDFEAEEKTAKPATQ